MLMAQCMVNAAFTIYDLVMAKIREAHYLEWLLANIAWTSPDASGTVHIVEMQVENEI